MKRKKWTEAEESTLINKYGELMRSGTLSRLKKREKKFDPIAQHVNGAHHLREPLKYPFRWTWRDVSVKIQNMRHQYLGVKQKIRFPFSPNHFNYSDGILHWPNFLHYKHVFGDIDLDTRHPSSSSLPPPRPPPPSSLRPTSSAPAFDPVFPYHDHDHDHDNDNDDDPTFAHLALHDHPPSFDTGGVHNHANANVTASANDDDNGNDDDDDDDDDDNVNDVEFDDAVDEGGGLFRQASKRAKKGVGVLDRECSGSEFLELRGIEEQNVVEAVAEEDEREAERVRREMERRRMRVEREFEEERRRKMKMEEKRDEEEMEWRERMMEMQMEHEKQMMQMFADACHGQMQVLGLVVRLVCQFFGSGGDGMGGGLGGIPSQVLQNMQHNGGLVGDNGKADGNSDAHFM